MESTVSTKKRAARKPAAKKDQVTDVAAAEPFAAPAEAAVPAAPAAKAKKPAVKKSAAKTAKAVKAEKAVPAAAEAKPLKIKARTIDADPFAELAEAVSPAGPVTAKPVKKAAKAPVKAVAKAAAKTAVKAAKKPVKKAVKAVKKAAAVPTLDVTHELAAGEPAVEVSPVFKALAEVALPELKRENRARLQMQTPTRLYFYWSLRDDPWSRLRAVFGSDLGSYSLVVKLIDNHHGREEMSLCDAEGNWWFNVEPNGSYTAELGFYAPNRPYFRILYSNTVETPRRSPSPRAATESTWTVSSAKFAEVLDVAGFSRDAFDVAVAGDNFAASEDATHNALADYIGSRGHDLSGISGDDIRYALLALAGGAALEELRFKISPALFAILQANAGNAGTAESGRARAMSALTGHFDIDESEFYEEDFGPAVFGASLVNFPKTLKTRTVSPKYAPRYNPVSSHSIR